MGQGSDVTAEQCGKDQGAGDTELLVLHADQTHEGYRELREADHGFTGQPGDYRGRQHTDSEGNPPILRRDRPQQSTGGDINKAVGMKRITVWCQTRYGLQSMIVGPSWLEGKSPGDDVIFVNPQFTCKGTWIATKDKPEVKTI